ncbi:MAG: sirohydrochlorin chelatase, partial [Gemmataceae bacterium]
ACVARGATTVTLLPYFLAPGVHVREDIAEHILQFQEQYPGVRFIAAEPLGRHPMLVGIVEERLKHAAP